ncbi:MAG: hypothetical protein EHM93_03965 [Bacteroidales bacterium]|nr:MAG: hypothetical protein EHM93_03965 [Bacteroidales bacterium]
MNEKQDAEIIALFHTDNYDIEYFPNVLRAWRANCKKGKIEEIGTKGINCINLSYGARKYKNGLQQRTT